VLSAKAEELQFQLSDNSVTVAVTVMMAMGRRILRTIHCRRPPSRPPRVRDDVVKTGEELTLTGKPTELIELSSSRVDEIDNFNMPSRTTGDPPGVSTSIGTRSIEQIRERFVVRKRLGNSVQTPEPIILSPDGNQPSGRVVVTTTDSGPNQPAVKSTIASGEVSCVVPDQPPPVREARKRRRSCSSSSSGSPGQDAVLEEVSRRRSGAASHQCSHALEIRLL